MVQFPTSSDRPGVDGTPSIPRVLLVQVEVGSRSPVVSTGAEPHGFFIVDISEVGHLLSNESETQEAPGN